MDAIKFQKLDKAAFRNEQYLAVHPAQAPYVCDNLELFVQSWKDVKAFDCFAVVHNATQVGFFALDFDFDRHANYVTTPNDFAVLRCFFIDQRYQNQGFAKPALRHLIVLLRTEYPQLKHLYLTVNYKNERALKIYSGENFNTLDKPYLGGSAGPQHVMKKQLSFA
jgi:ribosomal protein S18 acetylase RimI-like enzyme